MNKESRWRKLGETIALVYYMHWIYAAISVAISYVISSEYAKIILHSRISRLISIVIAAGVALIAVSVALYVAGRRRQMRQLFTNPDLDILSYEIILKFDDPVGQAIASHRITVRARKKEISTFIKKHHWPGIDSISLIKEEGVTEIGEVTQDRDRLWSYYPVNFESLGQGASHTIKFQVVGYDPERKALPYVSISLNDNFKGKLVLRAILPYRKIKSAKGLILPNLRSEVPDYEIDIPIDELTGEIRWCPPKLILSKVYKITWIVD